MKIEDKRVFRTLVVATLALVMGIGIGYLAGREGLAAREKNQPHTVMEMRAAEGDAAGALVSAKERFQVFTVNIFSCGHILERDEAMAVTGPEAETTLEGLGGYTYEIKDGRLAIYREYGYCCPKHYFTGLDGETAAVYVTDDSTLQPRMVCLLELEKGSVAYREIGDGMTFDSLEDINLYLEGMDE